MQEKLARFQSALDLFVDRLKEDRNILAAVLNGSLNDETIWRKESFYLWVIEADGVTKRLKSDGNDERIFRIFAEDEINFHVELIPRSRFKLMVEGSSRTAFSCNFFSHRKLIYCADASIKSWFQKANKVATKDQEKELMATTTWAISSLRHARNCLDNKNDLDLTKQAVIWAAHSIAAIEIVKTGEVYEQVAIYRAMELMPELFGSIYTDLFNKKPTKKSLGSALTAVEDYLEQHGKKNLKPVLHYLQKQKRTVGLSEMSEHFAYTQIYPWHIEQSCEWLSEQGILEKFSAPFKITKKSRSDVEEPSFMLIDE